MIGGLLGNYFQASQPGIQQAYQEQMQKHFLEGQQQNQEQLWRQSLVAQNIFRPNPLYEFIEQQETMKKLRATLRDLNLNVLFDVCRMLTRIEKIIEMVEKG